MLTSSPYNYWSLPTACFADGIFYRWRPLLTVCFADGMCFRRYVFPMAPFTDDTLYQWHTLPDGIIFRPPLYRRHPLPTVPFTDGILYRQQERNREHAKRSRIRKKFMLECLQEQLLAMRKQNMALRQVNATRASEVYGVWWHPKAA